MTRVDMTDHTVKAFTEQLESLSALVAQMGGLAEAQFASAIEAIARRDSGAAESAVGGDARIDAIQQEIEDRPLKLLALRQPMAVDLRETLAAIKTAAELERIGDLAKNIAKRALVLNREPPIRLTQSLARMGKAALSQLKQVLDSFSSRNAELAEAVWNQDGEIDEIERSGDHATNIAEVVYHMVRAGHLANNRPKADTTSETAVPFEAQH